MSPDIHKFKPLLRELIAAYYEMPECGAGGWLHVVLDDGNIDHSLILSCVDDAEKAGDTMAIFVGNVMMLFSDEELEAMYNKDHWGMRAAPNNP